MNAKMKVVIVSIGERTSKKGNLYYPVVAVQNGNTVNLYSDDIKIKGLKLYDEIEINVEFRIYKGQIQSPKVILS